MNHQAKPSALKNHNRLVLTGIASLALVACSAASIAPEEPPLAGADIGGPFELVNSAGETVRWADFRGEYAIVYFGYAFCPDICPTDMQRMTQALKELSERQPELTAKIQPIFITIDPERDTREVVDEFTNAFSDDVVGLTGSPEQVKVAADNFRVYYSKGEATPEGGYLVDHSNIVYLFDPDGAPLATLPTDEGPDAVAAEIEKWVS
ncbi:MAG: SCO family protein [Pseudomonadota bacterium]